MQEDLAQAARKAVADFMGGKLPLRGEQDYFMREAEVARVSGLSRTTRWWLERADHFPKRRQISAGATAWLASEVFALRAAQLGVSGAAPDGMGASHPRRPRLWKRGSAERPNAITAQAPQD